MSAQTSKGAGSDETEVACPFVGCEMEQATGCDESDGAASFTANEIRVAGTTWNKRETETLAFAARAHSSVSPRLLQRHSVRAWI